MNKLLLTFVLTLILTMSTYAQSKLKVITTVPDLAEIVRKIGGVHVEVESLLDGSEDAHFADASPGYIRRVADADIVCAVGLELEVGWLPKVLEKSGNAKVQPGGKGYCEAGKTVVVLDKPTGSTDRSHGDVHAAGNPHYNLSPEALTQASFEIEKVLVSHKPELELEFKKNSAAFQGEMKELGNTVRAKLAGLKDAPLMMEYHKEFSYFFKYYGLKSFGTIEEKPGVLPSTARIANVAESAKKASVHLALAAHYTPEKHLKRFTEVSGVPSKRVATFVQKNNEALNTIKKVQLNLLSVVLSAR